MLLKSKKPKTTEAKAEDLSLFRSWTVEETNDFLEILETIRAGMGVQLNPYGEGLQIPYFDPVEVGSRIIMATNPIQFLLRPDVKNIQSCHSLGGEAVVLAGNLSYMSSHRWGNMWITTKKDQATLACGGGTYQKYLDKYPVHNVISSTNFLVDEDNKMVYLSRTYGDSNANQDHSKAIKELFAKYGYGVGSIYSYERYFGSKAVAISVATPLQMVFEKNGRQYAFQKSLDITDASYVNVNGKVFSIENHTAYIEHVSNGQVINGPKIEAINLKNEQDNRHTCNACDNKFIKSDYRGLCNKCGKDYAWSVDIYEYLEPAQMAKFGLSFELFTLEDGSIGFEPVILLDNKHKAAGRHVYKFPWGNDRVQLRISIPNWETTLLVDSTKRKDKEGKPRKKMSKVARAFVRSIIGDVAGDSNE